MYIRFTKAQKELAKKILVTAQTLLAGKRKNGSGWIKHTQARVSKRGNYVNPTSSLAGAFCSIGAVNRAAHQLGLKDADPARQCAVKQLCEVMDGSITGSNDLSSTTFPQVMIAFDLAQVRLTPLPKTA
jgi:hypothetical protein